MNEYTIIGVALALIGIFKGKDVWEFLKHIYDCKKCKEENAVLKKKNRALESSNTRLKKLLK